MGGLLLSSGSITKIEVVASSAIPKDSSSGVAHEERRSSLFDNIMRNSVGEKEGDVEKRLRETGEWLVHQTETTSRSAGKQILTSVFVWVIPLWITAFLVASGVRVEEEMGTLETWRKAYGSLKDHTTVGLAHVNSDFKDVDVAIVKATNHVEQPPKERHLRKIMVATSAARPRVDVAYCIHALTRRLAKTHNWTVAIKTLIVIHRTLREGDPVFKEELLNFQQRGRVLQMSNFKDDSSPIAWDCSAWVRTYALFLEERLECFRILRYDIEAERLPRPAQGQDMGYSRTRELNSEELLEQLPALQQLLHRLIGCRPEGATGRKYLIQYSLALVLKESFKIYCAINDGIINLVDKFFEMPRHEAINAMDIYKRAGQQAASLSDFYEICKGLELARNFQFPALREPPQSFLVTMEEYIREAPRMVSVPSVALEYPERLMLTYKQEDIPPSSEDTKVLEEEARMPPPSDEAPISSAETAVSPHPPTNLGIDDLLGLNVTVPDASAIEESNALALAIVPSGTGSAAVDSDASQAKWFDPSGWELALVTTPSSNANLPSVQERQLEGGLDSLTLDSLYGEGAYRASSQQLQAVYGAPAPNPFEADDEFAVQMAATMPLQPQNENNPFAPTFQSVYPEKQQNPPFAPTFQSVYPETQQNPFGDPTTFGAFPVGSDAYPHPQTSNPFGVVAFYN
ncbi:ENTH/ANTH/VHS superfamily protein [Perilla frutescens var. hirtella]|uniref:ENTH/ANTH/VHS superfamily protein n=1 Tax=Perilla frutescens var. hirtella TaxID=608512 RepID=A0AAD4P5J9_PERFH|nr:ENTH/ANTH/VHS superfamily protein [Perilla frutescens var. hirtella]